MNCSEWTELLKEVSQLKFWLVSMMAGLFIAWLLSTLVRAWWAYKERRYQESKTDEKETAMFRREEAREARLGQRLDDMRSAQSKAYEEVIRPAVAIMASTQSSLIQFQATIKKCEKP